jgi:hypothetical protein
MQLYIAINYQLHPKISKCLETIILNLQSCAMSKKYQKHPNKYETMMHGR